MKQWGVLNQLISFRGKLAKAFTKYNTVTCIKIFTFVYRRIYSGTKRYLTKWIIVAAFLLCIKQVGQYVSKTTRDSIVFKPKSASGKAVFDFPRVATELHHENLFPFRIPVIGFRRWQSVSTYLGNKNVNGLFRTILGVN